MSYHTNMRGILTFSQPMPREVQDKIEELTDVDTRTLEGKFPGYYCPWQIHESRVGIEPSDNEQPRDQVEWLQYLLDTFLKPIGIQLNGQIAYQGEEIGDVGTIEVVDGDVIDVPWKNVLEKQKKAIADAIAELRLGHVPEALWILEQVQ